MAFPHKHFPDVVNDHVQQSAKGLGLVPEYMYATTLVAVSVLIGNRYQVEVQPGWDERPVLWVTLVGNSGMKKTPSVKAVLRFLEKDDAKSYATYQADLKDYKMRVADGEKGATHPISTQTIVDDATPEALIQVLRFNPQGVVWHKDELYSLILDGGRYSQSSGLLEKLMSMYSGANVRVNRKGDSEDVFLANPFVSIIGGIQPKILPELFKDRREDNGFIQRMLFAFPDDDIVRRGDGSDGTDTAENFESFLQRFRLLPTTLSPDGNVEPTTLSLTVEAREAFNTWCDDRVYPFINDKASDATLVAVMSKLMSVAIRLATIVEFCQTMSVAAEPKEIGEGSVLAGIELAEYFFQNFQRVLDMVRGESAEVPLPRNLEITMRLAKMLYDKMDRADAIRTLCEDFSQSEIHRATGISKGSINGYVRQTA